MRGGYRTLVFRCGALVALLLAIVPSGLVGAQQGEAVDLTALSGNPIAQGTNNQAVGFLNLKTYRVEELSLPSPLGVNLRGQTMSVTRAWRVVVSGGPFAVRDLPATIWIDNQAVGVGQESVDLSELSTVIFDRSVLRDGAVLAVSYQAELDRTELPERLSLTVQPS